MYVDKCEKTFVERVKRKKIASNSIYLVIFKNDLINYSKTCIYSFVMLLLLKVVSFTK